MNVKTVVIIYNASHYLLLFKQELIKSIQRGGFKVVAITSKDDYTPRLKKIVDEFYEINFDSSGTNPIKDLLITYRIYSICKKIRASLLLNFTIKPVIFGSIAGKLLKIPIINTVTGLGTAFNSKGLTNRIVKLLYKATFNYAHLAFFQNKDDQELFKELKIISRVNTKLISGSGVNLKKFKPTESLNTDCTIILFIGRIIADKGIYELIDSARIIKETNSNVTFQIMGELGANNKTAIRKEQIEKWEIEGLIEYIPFKEDIRDILGKSDVVILPSYREGTPKTLLEAASMAKPIIASDVPGCREVVKNGINGFLCQVKNSVSLAKAIKQFIDLDDSKKREMGLNSRKIAEGNFDVNKVNNMYIQEIHHALNY